MVQPSLLASDVGNLAAAVRELVAAGASWVHVDITDGSETCGRSLSCLGPASVAAVRAAAPALKIDVHLYTRDPEAHIDAVAAAGADRITFQMEAMVAHEAIAQAAVEVGSTGGWQEVRVMGLDAPVPVGARRWAHFEAVGLEGAGLQAAELQAVGGMKTTALEAATNESPAGVQAAATPSIATAQARAICLTERIRELGCLAGVCIAPATPVEVIFPLLAHVDLVNVLAVLPGIGGQPFHHAALDKVRTLYQLGGGTLDYLMVDGGIDAETAKLAAAAGANALVSGSFLFRVATGERAGDMAGRFSALEDALVTYGN